MMYRNSPSNIKSMALMVASMSSWNIMSRLKKLNIITKYSNSAVEDHGGAENQSLRTIEMQDPVANIKEKNQGPIIKVNEYEKIRQLNVLENQKRLEELGIKSIPNSMTSLAQSQKMKKKTLKQNTNVGDVECVVDAGDVSKKQRPPRYIAPMSTNRVANLSRLRRVMAPSEGNKGRAKRRMILVDEDDDEVDEIFKGIILMGLGAHYCAEPIKVADLDEDEAFQVSIPDVLLKNWGCYASELALLG
ncbi:hypothetical protein M8C21_023950 [Ambrosia artemisiifolia]|uniref:Uncharacterized protein n=1 Tax=Ambrosia artemisiifolia TaxID=4212 RepID=A0AAD5CQZ4_AMBAR|nr:hypothetical protein M8C21_023950 [Ambrosia artemisiifolia]